MSGHIPDTEGTTQTMSATDSFNVKKYSDLEVEMQLLAEEDGDVFLPNPEPRGQVNYVFICMEPSRRGWAPSKEKGKQNVAAGFRNFLADIHPYYLHFAIHKYLRKQGERYHLTDVSKGAKWRKDAGKDRKERYRRWYDLLLRELAIVAMADAKIIAVGNDVAAALRRHRFDKPFETILHYSPLAVHHRSEAIVGRQQQFQEFSDSLKESDFLKVVEAVLDESRIPDGLRRKHFAGIQGKFSEPGKRLIFTYKVAFESME